MEACHRHSSRAGPARQASAAGPLGCVPPPQGDSLGHASLGDPLDPRAEHVRVRVPEPSTHGGRTHGGRGRSARQTRTPSSGLPSPPSELRDLEQDKQPGQGPSSHRAAGTGHSDSGRSQEGQACPPQDPRPSRGLTVVTQFTTQINYCGRRSSEPEKAFSIEKM